MEEKLINICLSVSRQVLIKVPVECDEVQLKEEIKKQFCDTINLGDPNTPWVIDDYEVIEDENLNHIDMDNNTLEIKKYEKTTDALLTEGKKWFTALTDKEKTIVAPPLRAMIKLHLSEEELKVIRKLQKEVFDPIAKSFNQDYTRNYTFSFQEDNQIITNEKDKTVTVHFVINPKFEEK